MKAYIDVEKGLNINGKTIQKAVCVNSVAGSAVCLTFTDDTFVLLIACNELIDDTSDISYINYKKPHETDLINYEAALVDSEAMSQEEFNAIKKAVMDRRTAHENENNLLKLHSLAKRLGYEVVKK